MLLPRFRIRDDEKLTFQVDYDTEGRRAIRVEGFVEQVKGRMEPADVGWLYPEVVEKYAPDAVFSIERERDTDEPFHVED